MIAIGKLFDRLMLEVAQRLEESHRCVSEAATMTWQEMPIREGDENMCLVPFQLCYYGSPKTESEPMMQVPIYLRASVIKALEKAFKWINKRSDFSLMLMRGWRDLESQEEIFWRYMLKDTFSEVKPSKSITVDSATLPPNSPDPPMDLIKKFFESYPPAVRQRLWDHNQRLVTEAYDNPAYPPPHTTGGAVDVGLFDCDGEPIYFGKERNHAPYARESFFDFHPTRITGKLDSQDTARRHLLIETMRRFDFTPNANKIWHWDMGNQMSALFNFVHDKVVRPARYGFVKSPLMFRHY